jgi:anaphase-promoting complex subunit 3
MSSLVFAGSVPEIEDLFPSRPPPIKRTSPDEQQQQPPTKATHPPRPTATGLGFFTPDNGNSGNLFRRPEPVNALPVRMGRLGPRDSMWAMAQLHSYLISNIVPHRLTDDTVSHLPEVSILQAHQRAKGAAMLSSRALSSADEGGPALKKLRSTNRGMEKASKLVTAADDAHSKKARARPALTLVNLFSSAGRRPQPTATSSRHAPAASNRLDRDGNGALGGATRRSARLMGTGSRPPIPSKVGELTPG